MIDYMNLRGRLWGNTSPVLKVNHVRNIRNVIPSYRLNWCFDNTRQICSGAAHVIAGAQLVALPRTKHECDVQLWMGRLEWFVLGD